VPRFQCSGRDGSGGLVKGVLDAVDSSAVATQLLALGTTPVAIEPARDGTTEGKNVGSLLARLGRPRVETPELMLFSRQMYLLLKAGVPIMRALSGL